MKTVVKKLWTTAVIISGTLTKIEGNAKWTSSWTDLGLVIQYLCGDGTERTLSTSAGEIRWAELRDVGAWDQDLKGSQQNGKTDQEWAAFLFSVEKDLKLQS